MKRFVVLYLLLTVFVISGQAQIENEIKSYQDSTVILANKAKSLMLKYASEGRSEKVAEIYSYLNERVADPKANLFTYSSELYVLLISRQWNLWVEHAVYCKKYFGDDLYPGIEDYTDQFFYELQDQVVQMRMDLQKSNLPAIDKAMIKIFFGLIESGVADEDYENAVKDFKREYKLSKYSHFLGQYLPIVKTDFKVTSELGPRLFIPANNLADTFDGRMGFFVGAGFQIEKFYLNFVAGMGALSLNYPVEASNEADLITFEEGEKFQFYNFSVEAGYALFEKDKIGITPYFSVGYAELNSPDFEYDGENTFLEVYTSTSVGPGVRLQYTLTRIDYRTIYGAVIPAEISFILKGGYNFIPESNEEIFKGDMAYFSFGIALGTIY